VQRVDDLVPAAGVASEGDGRLYAGTVEIGSRRRHEIVLEAKQRPLSQVLLRVIARSDL
jgi:hypothetical protein